MAREPLLVNELQQNRVPGHALVHTTSYDALQDIFLEALRDMFARHPEYTYVGDPERGFNWPDLDKTKITIWQEYPLDTLFLPNITTSVSSLRDHPMSFNQDREVVKFLYDDRGNLVHDERGFPIPIYFEYASAWDGSFSIAVNAGSPVERDLLVDFVKIAMMHLYRDWFYMRGVHIKTVSAGGTEVRDWKSDKIYRTTVTVETYSEWNHRIPYPTGPLLDKIKYKIGMPITQAIFTSEGYVVRGGADTSTGTLIDPAPRDQIQSEQTSYDLKPSSVMDTISYDLVTNHWQITQAWWTFIANQLNEQELAQKYGISQLSEITVETWMDILASVSSPARMGYPRVISDLTAGLEKAATDMGVSPDADLSSSPVQYNRVRELQILVRASTTRYHTDVTRYSVTP